MPVVDIKVNVPLSEQTVAALSCEVTEALAASLDPSCTGVLVAHSEGPIFVNASSAPAAWIRILTATDMSIEAKRCLCGRLGDIVAKHGAIDPGRVFLQLSRVAPEDAWNLGPDGPRCVLDRMCAQRPAEEPSCAAGPMLPQA